METLTLDRPRSDRHTERQGDRRPARSDSALPAGPAPIDPQAHRRAIAARLREALSAYELRVGRAVSYAYLAEAMEHELSDEVVDPSAISRYFSARNPIEPTMVRLAALCRVLGANPGYVAFGDVAVLTASRAGRPRDK